MTFDSFFSKGSVLEFDKKRDFFIKLIMLFGGEEDRKFELLIYSIYLKL